MSISNILQPNNYTIYDKNSVIDTLTITGDSVNQSISTTQLYNAVAFSESSGTGDDNSLAGYGATGSFVNVTVGEGLQLSSNVLSSASNIISGTSATINLLAAGSTLLLTVPGNSFGPRFYLSQIVFILTGQTAIESQASFSIGTNSGGPYNDIVPDTNITGGFGEDAFSVYTVIPIVSASYAFGGSPIYININTPAVATFFSAKCYINGFLI